MNVWLDLEETVFESWDCWWNSMNTRKLVTFLRANNVERVGIFSFAVYNETDKTTFNSLMKNSIQQELGVEIISVLSIEDIISIYWKKRGVRIDQHDVLHLIGKQQAFIDVMTLTAEPDSDSVLIDDVVDDVVVTNQTKSIKIRTLNVKTLTH